MNVFRTFKWACASAAVVLLLVSSGRLISQETVSAKWSAPTDLELHGVKAEATTYLGRQAVRITDVAAADAGDSERLAVIKGSAFRDGTISATLTGNTLDNAFATARGFVGIAFRVSADRSHFECFYLRPTNGRADDQLRRNHSLQYVSVPGFGWEKLRTESPGVYESYADLVPGQWTQVKIQVAGSHAKLFVNGAEQPALIVNDLKQPPTSGAIALWVGPGTVANFADIKVTP
jgi:hypothetical protein